MTKKLHPHFKAKWLEALRSGEYKQVKENLHTKKGFCCLGVACHLYDPNQWQEYKAVDVNGGKYTAYQTVSGSLDLPHREDLPPEIYDALIQRFPGAFENVMRTIAQMNDDGEHSFADIADWIEEHL